MPRIASSLQTSAPLHHQGLHLDPLERKRSPRTTLRQSLFGYPGPPGFCSLKSAGNYAGRSSHRELPQEDVEDEVNLTPNHSR